MANQEDVHLAIHYAQETFDSGVWSKAPAIHRAAVLSVLARNLGERIHEFARIESMQTGRAIREMTAQLGRLPEWMWVELPRRSAVHP